MICEVCEGEGYRRGHDPQYPGALVVLPCLECNGSGVASCCDAAGSRPAKAWPHQKPDPYQDQRFSERPCDRCGKPYRGKAVYCSLTCAIADA